MGDETMVPLLEVVRRERAAFRSGVDAVACYITIGSARSGWPGTAALHASADARYPLPTVERPRVVVVQDKYNSVYCLRVTDGELEWAGKQGRDWSACDSAMYHWPAVALRAIADLLENPTETVPADA